MRALTKGPFYHDVKELLLHVLEVHIRVCWCLVSQNSNLSDLHNNTPKELKILAEKIVDEYASGRAMMVLNKDKDDVDYDEVKYQMTMMLCDILHYATLENAIKYGDTDVMFNMIPHLLFCFHGGSNPKYAIEMMEFLQSFHREWLEDVRYAQSASYMLYINNVHIFKKLCPAAVLAC